MCRAIEVAGVAVGTFVEVLLEGIEEVLHTTIQLELQVLAEHEGIVHLDVEIEEIGGVDQFILGDVGVRIVHRDFVGRSKMGNVHAAGIDTRQRTVEVVPRGSGEGEIAVTVRGARHVASSCHRGVFAPRGQFVIAAALYGEAHL